MERSKPLSLMHDPVRGPNPSPSPSPSPSPTLTPTPNFNLPVTRALILYKQVRGGAPLKTIIEDECPDEMRDEIFTSTREVITLSPSLTPNLVLIPTRDRPLRYA